MRKKEETAYGVIGLGRFGEALAIMLAQSGKEVIVVDRDESKIKEMRQYTECAFVTENLSAETLKEIGIQNCDVVIICIGEKADVSILITMSVIEMGVPRVIAKAFSPEQGAVLEKIGAEVVYPERDMALRLGKRLLSNSFIDFVSLCDSVEIRQLQAPESLLGRTVEETQMRRKYRLNIIAIVSGDHTEIEVMPDYRLKTKIVCTLGPATDEGNVLEQLIQEGMDVARFNFSHGTHEEQKARLDRLKELRTKYDRPIAAMLDTKGPEIRIGCFKEGEAVLEEGQIFTLVSRNVEGTRDYVSITYKELYKDVSPGDTILIDDGLIEMEVKEISGEDIACLVRNGGRLSDQKGVNIPGTELNMEFLSKKDRADLLFGIQEDFDFVAASFTRTAEDIREMRLLLDENGGRDINIIAKIENQQGVDQIDEIIEAADGIMIARGDMGVEIPLERVRVIQQTII